MQTIRKLRRRRQVLMHTCAVLKSIPYVKLMSPNTGWVEAIKEAGFIPMEEYKNLRVGEVGFLDPIVVDDRKVDITNKLGEEKLE